MTSWNLSLLVPSMMIQRHQQSWTCHHHLISVFFPHCVPTASYCQLHGTESLASSSAATSARPFIFPPRRDVVFPALFLQRAPSSHLPTTYPSMQLNLIFLLIVKYIMARPPAPPVPYFMLLLVDWHKVSQIVDCLVACRAGFGRCPRPSPHRS